MDLSLQSALHSSKQVVFKCVFLSERKGTRREGGRGWFSCEETETSIISINIIITIDALCIPFFYTFFFPGRVSLKIKFSNLLMQFLGWNNFFKKKIFGTFERSSPSIHSLRKLSLIFLCTEGLLHRLGRHTI